LTDNGGCDDFAICTNTPGSFNCTCLIGYSGNGFNCSGKIFLCAVKLISLTKKLDIDECSTNNGGCHIDANCYNTQGSFNCTCKDGFSGDGFNCTGRILFISL